MSCSWLTAREIVFNLRMWVQIRVMFLSMFAITEASKLYGSEGCPCVGIDVGTWDTFPPEIGTTCSAWDENTNSLCKGPNPPEFCSQRWWIYKKLRNLEGMFSTWGATLILVIAKELTLPRSKHKRLLVQTSKVGRCTFPFPRAETNTFWMMGGQRSSLVGPKNRRQM